MGSANSQRVELEAYRPALMKCALTLTQDWSDAEDLVQRTFEKALGARFQLIEPERRGNWLRVIMKNLSIDEGRRENLRRRTMERERQQLRVQPPAQDLGGRVALKRRLGHLLREIPAEMAQALLLVSVEGFTYAEVAEVQGVVVGTVKSRVARARKILAASLVNDGDLVDEEDEHD